MLDSHAISVEIIEALSITSDIQRENRLKLADMLENRVTDKQFNMRTFTNRCGTVGCALGIAVLSGEFEGLQWGWGLPTVGGVRYPVPGVRGRKQSWSSVGVAFFGKTAMDKVFFGIENRSRHQVAQDLRAITD